MAGLGHDIVAPRASSNRPEKYETENSLPGVERHLRGVR
jgi:hypothetical protein